MVTHIQKKNLIYVLTVANGSAIYALSKYIIQHTQVKDLTFVMHVVKASVHVRT
jgi:hypothetical protein